MPAITHPVTIDGYTQANIPVAYRYPDQVTSAVQDLIIGGGPTGGTFTLTTLAPLPVGTTPPIPYTATPEQVQDALVTILVLGTGQRFGHRADSGHPGHRVPGSRRGGSDSQPGRGQ